MKTNLSIVSLPFDEIKKCIPSRKSLLADAAYSGGEGLGKKWINDIGIYYDGYNKALDDVLDAILRAAEHRFAVDGLCPECSEPLRVLCINQFCELYNQSPATKT